MAFVTRTVTGDLRQMFGDSIDVDHARGYAETNLGPGFAMVFDLANDRQYLGSGRLTINSDGTWELTDVPDWNNSSADQNPTGVQVQIRFEYVDQIAALGAPNARRTKQWASGWLQIDHDGSIGEFVAEQLAPPDWRSDFMTEAEALLAQQEEIAGLADSDAAQAYNVEHGPLTGSALSATLDQRFDPNDVGWDVILCGMDSNASGRAGAADARIDVTDPRIFQFGTNSGFGTVAVPGDLTVPRPAYCDIISIAQTPLLHADGGNTLGYAVNMARDYARSIPANRKVLLVPLAFGGTNLTEHWSKGLGLYNLMLLQAGKALAAAGPNSRIAGIWVQEGTNDAGGTAAAFQTRLDAFIDDIRADLGIADLPVVLSGIPLFSTQANQAACYDVLVDTPRRKLRTGFHHSPDTFVGDLTYDNLDGSHNHGNQAWQRFLAAGGAAASRIAELNILGVDPVAPAAAPTGVQTGTTLTIAWPAALCRATDYTVEYRTGAGSWSTLTRTKPLFNRGQAITGLTKGSTYEVRVSTVNEEGTSAPSPALTFPMLTDPAQVTGLTLGTPTAGTVAVSWSAAARAETYTLEYRVTGAGSWTAITGLTGLSRTIAGLTPLTGYDVRVTAVNAAGSGTASTTSTFTTSALDILHDALTAPAKAAAFGYYSVARRVYNSYTGPLIRVRRSSDNTEQDIAQTAGKLLDEAALLTFVGAGDGYITKIYEQSPGAATDVVQVTTASQPQIVAAGVVTKVNGRPAVLQSTAQMVESTGVGLYAAGACTAYAVHRSTGVGEGIVSETGSGGNPRYYPFQVGTSGNVLARLIINDAGTTVLTGNTSPQRAVNTGYHCSGVIDSGTSSTIRQDGVVSDTVAVTRAGVLTITRFGLFGSHRSSIIGTPGYWSEVVLFTAALGSTDLAAIENNLAQWYATAA